MRTQLFGMIAMVTSMAALAACKEDPPPPPPMADTAAASTAAPKPVKPSARDRTQVPRIGPETMKQYRVETCYFGSMGLTVARDAYLSSLGGKPPSEANLPSFGDYPENKPKGASGEEEGEDKGDKATPRKAGRAPLMGTGRALPFIRHVRACSIAKSLKTPPYPELDPAVAEFESYVNRLQKLFLDASRYYAREQYKKDEFKRGKSIHEKLSEELPKLDDQLAAFTKAMEAWWPTMKDGEEKLDDAGKISDAAVKEARTAVREALSPNRDAAALGKEIEGLKAKLAELEEKLEADRTAPHPRVVTPRLKELIAALEAVQGVEGPLTPAQSYPVSAGMASLIEAHQRGLAQLLRRNAMGSGAPMRMRPRLRDDSVRMVPRPGMTSAPKVKPRPAPAQE